MPKSKRKKRLDLNPIALSAEKPGFEPGLRLSHTTPLAGEPLRPLGYFSIPSRMSKIRKRRERDSNPRCR